MPLRVPPKSETQLSQEPEIGHGEPRVQLREYLAILWVRKWPIILVTLVVVGAAMVFSARQTPLYASEARFLVQETTISGQDTTGKALNMETQRELVSSLPVAEIVAEDVGAIAEPRALLRNLEIEVVPGTEILAIRYQSPDPQRTQEVTDAFARGYAEFRRRELLAELEAASEDIREQIQALTLDKDEALEAAAAVPPASTERGELDAEANAILTQINLLEQELSDLVDRKDIQVGDIIEPALLPTEPVSPDYVRSGILALAVGLLLGVGVAFLAERLDDGLRGRQDLEARLGAPVLAVIPRVATWRRRRDTPVVTVTEPRAAPAEAYRTLRTSLLFAASQRDAKTLLVTSPHAGEGKTATSANLAVTLAQARKRVLLISADLRKPRIHRFFGISNDVGLTSLLIGEARPWEAVVDVGFEHLKVVPSGPVPGNPAELLGSDAMGRLLAQFREVAEFVILDSAPAMVVADALTLAPFADAALFVADAEQTSRGAVTHARNQLEQVNVKVIGAVLNNFDPARARAAAYYYSYYYTYRYEETPRRAGRLRRRVSKDEGPYPVGVAAPSTGYEPTESDRLRAADLSGRASNQSTTAASEIEGLWAPHPPPPPPPEDRPEPDGRAGWRFRRRR
jgi:succinoglycan biosynthesis transport protein ExoP